MFSLSSPRYSKIHNQLQSQLSSILHSPNPSRLKILLIQTLISHIKHKSTSLKIKRCLATDPLVEQKELWKHLEKLQSQIMEKRRQKEDMENLIDMHCTELEEMDEVLDVKEQIRWKINQELYERTAVYTVTQSEKVLTMANEETEPTFENQSFCV